jgi:hypothetical protein
MTRTSFHCAWNVGLTVRVVLCSVSAWLSLDAFAKDDAFCSGVLSIVAMMRPASAMGAEPAVAAEML